MHPKAKYLFIASMDIDPDKEKLFNEIYDTEHIPSLLQVPGVLSAIRTTNEPFAVMIGGQRHVVIGGDEPKYSAIFELENADVLVSEAWAKAVEQGRWTAEVRPYTRNRRHFLKRIMDL